MKINNLTKFALICLGFQILAGFLGLWVSFETFFPFNLAFLSLILLATVINKRNSNLKYAYLMGKTDGMGYHYRRVKRC